MRPSAAGWLRMANETILAEDGRLTVEAKRELSAHNQAWINICNQVVWGRILGWHLGRIFYGTEIIDCFFLYQTPIDRLGEAESLQMKKCVKYTSPTLKKLYYFSRVCRSRLCKNKLRFGNTRPNRGRFF